MGRMISEKTVMPRAGSVSAYNRADSESSSEGHYGSVKKFIERACGDFVRNPRREKYLRYQANYRMLCHYSPG